MNDGRGGTGKEEQDNRAKQLNLNNAAFWSSRKGAAVGAAADAFQSDDYLAKGDGFPLRFSDCTTTAIQIPKGAVGYALHGKVEKGTVDLTPEHPLLMIFVRKTPKQDTCGGAFNAACKKYPTLEWRELPGIKNGAMPGEPPPYWCMRMTRNEQGVVELDQGYGFNSLEGVVDGLVRAPLPKAPCGLDAPRPHCPDCKKPMEHGTASRATERGYLDAPLHWQALDRRTHEQRGSPGFKAPPLLLICTYRCPACGLLRDYAFERADWHAWSKAEEEKSQGEPAG